MKTAPIDSSPLERYGINLTYLARQGMFTPLVGYEVCIMRIFQILLRKGKTRRKYNPLLLDLDEIRIWQIITEVVRRMAIGEAPDPLPTWKVMVLNYEALLANLPDAPTGYLPLTQQVPTKEDGHIKALLESKEEELSMTSVTLSRLQALFLAMSQAEEPVLLFVNQFHRLLRGELQRSPIDAASLLQPTLARCEIQFVGACTPSQYEQYVMVDAAIECRIQEVYIKSDEEINL